MNVNMLADDFVTLFMTLFVALVISQVMLSGVNYLFVKKIFETISDAFSRYLTSFIEIHEHYPYGSNVSSWVNEFIEHKCGNKLGHFRFSNDIFNNHWRPMDTMTKSIRKKKKEDEDDSWDIIKKRLEPLPTNWSVFFWYKMTCIRVVRSASPEFRGETVVEVFKITAYFTRNKQLLIEMMEEARKMAETKPGKQINYFRADICMDHSLWRLVRRVNPRALSSIILREGVTKAIQEDMEDFLESRQWYKERGIPYRRGYLLYGPPGCGKTSFVKAISGQIGYDIYEMPLTNLELSDKHLNKLMSSVGQKSILLFEDVDAAFVARPQDEEWTDKNDVISGILKIRESKAGITFSGLLNAIDGVASEEDYIVFMTTNFIDKLDKALIRPGRIDMKQLIDYPDEKQIETFFTKFYPHCNDKLAPKFAKSVKDPKCNPSVAQIQGIFLKHKKEPQDSLLDVASLVETCKENVDHQNLYV